jgi:hypothetical protein
VRTRSASPSTTSACAPSFITNKTVREVRSLDVVLPTAAGPEMRLRTVSRSEPHLAILLECLDFPLPNRPKKIQNEVAIFYQNNKKRRDTVAKCLISASR